MIIGGQAVLLYGEPRLTKDIDITLGIGVNEHQKILSATDELGLKVLAENPIEFISQFMVLPALDKNTGIKIDFIFSFTPYEQQAIKRSKIVKIENANVNFATLEDVIIHKIFAGRARDLEDVRIILLKNPNYNKEYIVKWLSEFDKSLREEYVVKFKEMLRDLA